MRTNIHRYERLFRVVAGLFVASLAFWGPAHPAFLLGLVLVVTGAVGWCPPYALLGISTCAREA